MSYLLSKVHDGVNRLMFGKEAKVVKTAFYDCVDRAMSGKEVPMSNYKGDVVMVVNVASKWGLTKKNYTQMSEMATEYKDRGFKMLAFPCNQFGGQEPGTHEEILEFTRTIDPEIPDKLVFFEKADVNGSQTREVFGFLKEALPADDGTEGIRWNFTKFLVDHEGKPFKRFGPTTNPYDIKADIDELLKKREA